MWLRLNGDIGLRHTRVANKVQKALTAISCAMQTSYESYWLPSFSFKNILQFTRLVIQSVPIAWNNLSSLMYTYIKKDKILSVKWLYATVLNCVIAVNNN